MASYPTSVKSFTSKNAGDVIQPAHVNDLQDEVNALENGLLNGLQHQLTVSTGGLTVSTGSVNIGGPSSLTTLHVNGGSTFSSGVTISSGGLTVSTGNVTLGQNLSIAGSITSTLTLANQFRLAPALSTLSGGSTRFDNVAVPSTAGVVFISYSSAASISGISGGTHGRVLYLVSVGGVGSGLQLLSGDANSSADCRMVMSANTPKVLSANGSAMLVYSTVTSNWYVLADRT